MIPVTDREMQRAWRQNQQAYQNAGQSCTNAHRLLLFYTVECGLKAVFMKRRGYNCTDSCPEFADIQHDINKLIDAVKAGSSLKLPDSLSMKPLNNGKERKLTNGEINQIWRYGGELKSPTDSEVEEKLKNIIQWIRGELGKKLQ